MTLKAWPEDGKPVDFEDLAEPLLATIRQACRFEVKTLEGLRYDGYDVGIEVRAISPGLGQRFTPDMFAYNEERGRDPIACFIIAAVQLGIEQGKRMQMQASDDDFEKRTLKIERDAYKGLYEKMLAERSTSVVNTNTDFERDKT